MKKNMMQASIFAVLLSASLSLVQAQDAQGIVDDAVVVEAPVTQAPNSEKPEQVTQSQPTLIDVILEDNEDEDILLLERIINNLAPISVCNYSQAYYINNVVVDSETGAWRVDTYDQDEVISEFIKLKNEANSARLEKIKSLIASGADVNMQDKEGHSALWLASEREQQDIVAALIAAGAHDEDQDDTVDPVAA